VIQALLGRKPLSALQGDLEVGEEAVERAIAALVFSAATLGKEPRVA